MGTSWAVRVLALAVLLIGSGGVISSLWIGDAAPSLRRTLYRQMEGEAPPKVYGLPLEKAEERLRDEHFEPVVIDRVACEGAPPDTVIFQIPEPPANTTDDTVELVLSSAGTGPCRYAPPATGVLLEP